MADRTAAEVLAEKLNRAWKTEVDTPDNLMIWGEPVQKYLQLIAARVAEDPAITVRTDMAVERFVVEYHYDSTRHPTDTPGTPLHWAGELYEAVTTTESINDFESHRIIVRPLDGDR